MTEYNLAALLEKTAAEYSERIAIIAGERRMTFAAVEATANQVANLLVSRGIGPGNTVALMCPNVPEFTTTYFGILKTGATVVPLNILLKSREVVYHLEDADAKILIAFNGSSELPIADEAFSAFETATATEHFFVISPTSDNKSFVDAENLTVAMSGHDTTFDTIHTDEDDTAVILYTSGTTGKAKGAELRHRNMRDNVLACQDIFGLTAEAPDSYLSVLPLFHSFGQTVIQNCAIAFGGTLVMLHRFDAREALGLMLDESISVFAGVPTMYWGLLRALDDSIDVERLAENLRLSLAGGSALPIEIHREFHERFGVSILEGYGLSETSPVASFTRLGHPPRAGSVGLPIPGVEMGLLDPQSGQLIDPSPNSIGELAVKGSNVFKGYLNRPDDTRDAFSSEGWFRTGDLGRRDADGWYYVVDRAKDLVIRGGFNVYPREVEEVLLTHPAISLAAVIGVPHPSHGEDVKAIVVLEPDAAVTPEEIVAWGKGRMASYKYPRNVTIVDSLPMTATGKILKRALS
ncbi:long-chain-fatty-acid--CoA ligase [Rhodococcus sp. ACPA4]|uniref:long-chain-fatty-acid--CoA ligase n=1 Tax=Rhodococcus sp. ACPA4 TaxID=2028571 RepID=UPI000BB0CE27|nr:long-chain fatty acid--CoA ligase [Rhodococcus sp. ACPA4]PBC36078.1 long-chain-fatty-acid--CoA ligase [Rhodococcus sp. ACPA4]